MSQNILHLQKDFLMNRNEILHNAAKLADALWERDHVVKNMLDNILNNVVVISDDDFTYNSWQVFQKKK